MMLDRTLFTSMAYPADYGFIDGTLGEDGDPLDALVLVTEPTFPGCCIYVRPIGVFHMEDEKGPDEKIICVPLKDPRWSQAETVEDIGFAFMDELEHFFQVYKDLEEGKVETGGFTAWTKRGASSAKRASAPSSVDTLTAACRLATATRTGRPASRAPSADGRSAPTASG